MLSDLREAIEAAVAEAVAEAEGTQGLVVSEYVVVALTNGFDDDGENISQVIMIPDGNESRILGLLEHARVQMYAEVLDG